MNLPKRRAVRAGREPVARQRYPENPNPQENVGEKPHEVFAFWIFQFPREWGAHRAPARVAVNPLPKSRCKGCFREAMRVPREEPSRAIARRGQRVDRAPHRFPVPLCERNPGVVVAVELDEGRVRRKTR